LLAVECRAGIFKAWETYADHAESVLSTFKTAVMQSAGPQALDISAPGTLTPTPGIARYLFCRALAVVSELCVHQALYGTWCREKLTNGPLTASLYRVYHTSWGGAHPNRHVQAGLPLACALPAECRAALLSRAAAAGAALDPAAVANLRHGGGGGGGAETLAVDALRLLGWLTGPRNARTAMLRDMSHAQVEGVLAALPGLWVKVRC
jgi:hypothetical protein